MKIKLNLSIVISFLLLFIICNASNAEIYQERSAYYAPMRVASKCTNIESIENIPTIQGKQELHSYLALNLERNKTIR